VNAESAGSIDIATDVLEAILAHARAEAPRECCGLLLGSLTEIRRAAPARNLATSPSRYDIDPADHFRILREARAAGLTVMGAYHSHPASAPVPSPTDLAEGLPNFLYIIATLRADLSFESLESGMRAYYFDGPAFREVRLTRKD
jgi:proteasome lid subunit RPN8/RPN11